MTECNCCHKLFCDRHLCKCDNFLDEKDLYSLNKNILVKLITNIGKDTEFKCLRKIEEITKGIKYYKDRYELWIVEEGTHIRECCFENCDATNLYDGYKNCTRLTDCSQCHKLFCDKHMTVDYFCFKCTNKDLF